MRVAGVPETISPGYGERLLKPAESNRKCQFVVEPTFATAYAVWFTQSSGRGEATVSVTVFDVGGVRELPPVPLDHSTAEQLSFTCEAAVQALAAECVRPGYDGSWVHAAHDIPHRGYVMASYWVSRSNHLMQETANLAEALRDYAVVPEEFRPEKWIRIQNVINALHAEGPLHSSAERR
jgi:hypothetical protein